MTQNRLFSSKQLWLGASIVVIASAIIGFYWANRTPEQPVAEPTVTSMPTPVRAETEVSFSPVSPVSPPAPAEETNTSPEIEALVQRGISFYENQAYQEAIQVFNDALALDPNSALAYNARGSAYLDLKEYEKAITDYTKAIELEPLFPFAYYNRGRAYSLLEQYDKAIADLQEAVQLSPGELGYRANGNLGLIYHQTGEYNKALEAFAAAISSDDTKADTFYFRGETYTVMEDYASAVGDYQAAISRFPNYAKAYQGLGYAYYKTDQFEQALEALDQALALAPDSPGPHFYQMLVYLATNQEDKAQAAVSQGMDAIGALSDAEQTLLFSRVLQDLERFAQDNPDQAESVEALVNLIPPSP